MPFIGGSEADFTDALQRVDSELGANTATCQQLRRAAKLGADPEKPWLELEPMKFRIKL